MVDPIATRVDLVFFSISALVFGWIAWDTKRALTLLFQRRGSSLSANRVGAFRGMAIIAFIMVVAVIVQRAVRK
jgi:hypothetical protein